MDISSMLLCTDADPEVGFFDFSIAPDILYYAYVPIIIIALSIGVFVLVKDKYSHISKALFFITLLFSIFIANELIQWIAVPAGVIYFGWAVSLLIHFLIIVATVYFVALFALKKDVPFLYKALFSLFALPIIFFLPTDLNLTGFDIEWCEGITGPLWNYLYGFEFACSIGLFGTALYLLSKRKKIKREALMPTVYLLIGASFFLFILFGSYFFADYTGLYGINFVGPLGMLIFVCVLSYIIVQFKVFNIKLIAAQALMIFLWALIGSLLFVAQSTTTKVVAGFTLVAAVGLGMMLVRNIQKTIKQKEEIEKLAEKLEVANERLKELDKMKSEFVSIASHQLRSPLTSIRGYASMLIEGTYGQLPPKVKDVVERISESSHFMASSIEDYLNVSRIQAGNMKYEYSDFNLNDLASRVADDIRQSAVKKGLLLTFKSNITKRGIVHADVGKTRQIIDNLINNSLKYTPKGYIEVSVHDNWKNRKIFVDIKDSGIGMSPKTLNNIFGKFSRAENANAVNVTGTGLGLFIAQKMARDMGGDVTASSEGEGRGSTFTLELPLQL